MPNIESSTSVVSDAGNGIASKPSIVDAELVHAPSPMRGWIGFLGGATCAGLHWLFGLASLIVILSVLATIPLLQFLSLGYLIESSGRVLHSRRFRDGFVGIDKAARVGSVGLGIFLTLLPVRLIGDMGRTSELLNGDVAQTRGLRAVVFVLGIFAMGHIAWATIRGGKLRHFAWPAPLRFWHRVRAGGMYDEASRRLWDFFQGLRLPHYFWLGFRGFVGAFVWLFVPITMMALATKIESPELGGLTAVIGGFLLSVVLVYLPFLQARLPMTNRFWSQFEWRQVRQDFKRAPIAYWVALLLTLALAIPLYLLKAELIPREAAWLPSLVFVTLMLPARLAVGWAVGRGSYRGPKTWFGRLLDAIPGVAFVVRLGLLPIALIYSLIVYFTQFTSWHGSLSLYEQHAFMVPVPFLGF